jgi:hypothetical protein
MSHVAARPFGSFADAVGDTARFTYAYANVAVIIANDDNCAEGEATSAFDHFSDTFDVNYALVQFFAIFVPITSWFSSSFSHRQLLHR